MDGELRSLFRTNLRSWHWTAIETYTEAGVPDAHFCHRGVSGWVECKRARGWVSDVSPQQVAWIERQLRAGGRVFVATRRGQTLYIHFGSDARVLCTREITLRDVERALIICRRPWNWRMVGALLLEA